MARVRKKRGSSYRPQEYFRGVKSSTDDQGSTSRRGGLGDNKRSASWRSVFVSGFVVAVVLSGLLIVGYVDSADVSITGPSPYDVSELHTRVQAYLDSSIVRRFKPFISESALLEHVQQTHPDVAEITVSMSPISPTITATVMLRSPALIWNNSDGSQLVVDVNGVAYAERDEVYHRDLIIEVSDSTQPRPALTTQVLSAQLVQYIRLLDGAVHQLTDLTSHRYELPLGAREIRLKAKNYDVRFSLDRFEEEQALELKQLLGDLKRRHIIVPNEYIDLRTEDKAFYR